MWRATMETRGWTIALAMTLAVTLAGCGGGGSGNTDPDDNSGSSSSSSEPPSVSGADLLSGAGPVLTEIAPMSRLPLAGLPQDFDTDQLSAHYRPADDGRADNEDAHLPVLINDGNVYLVTPLYDPEGVELNVALYADDEFGTDFDLTLSALPPAQDGAIDELVTAIEGNIEAQVEAMGMDYPGTLEHWRDQGFNDMPPILLPIMQSWLTVVDPENDRALANLEYGDEERELIGRILATGELAPALEAHTGQVTAGELPLDLIADTDAAITSTTQLARLNRSPVQSTALISGQSELEAIIPIDGPESLSEQMHNFEDARRIQRNAELFDETVGNYVTVVGLLAALPSGGSSAAASTAGREAVKRQGVKLLEFITGAVDSAGNLSGMATWVLPCCITNVDVETLPEDGQITNEDEPENQLALVSVRVDVETQGFDAAREALDRVFEKLLDDGGDELKNTTFWQELGGEVDDQITDEAKSFLLDQLADTELVFTWDGIELMDETPQYWIDHEVDTFNGTGEPIIAVDDWGNPDIAPEYEFFLVTPAAFERQRSLLRIRPDMELFPQGVWSNIVHETVSVDLEYIEPALEPQVQRVTEVPQTVEFDVVVEHALHDTVEIINAEGTVVTEAVHGDTFTVEVDEPPGEDGYNLEYWVVSTSEGGIRSEQGAPVRSGTGVILVRSEDEEDDDNEEDDPELDVCADNGWLTPEYWDEIKDDYPSYTEVWLTTHRTDEPVLQELQGEWEVYFYHPEDEDRWARFDASLGGESLALEPAGTSDDANTGQGSITFGLIGSGYKEEEAPPGWPSGTAEYWRYVFENDRGEILELESNTLGQLVNPAYALDFVGRIDADHSACEFDIQRR